jgi:hypothetical protein
MLAGKSSLGLMKVGGRTVDQIVQELNENHKYDFGRCTIGDDLAKRIIEYVLDKYKAEALLDITMADCAVSIQCAIEAMSRDYRLRLRLTQSDTGLLGGPPKMSGGGTSDVDRYNMFIERWNQFNQFLSARLALRKTIEKELRRQYTQQTGQSISADDEKDIKEFVINNIGGTKAKVELLLPACVHAFVVNKAPSLPDEISRSDSIIGLLPGIQGFAKTLKDKETKIKKEGMKVRSYKDIIEPYQQRTQTQGNTAQSSHAQARSIAPSFANVFSLPKWFKAKTNPSPCPADPPSP